jgi:hypothetical protein
MQINCLGSLMKKAMRVAAVLLLGAGFATAQTQQINLTAAPTIAIMPDGNTVNMWGYTCGLVVSGSTATCAAANSNTGAGWSPVVINAVTGSNLQINLQNKLQFANNNSVPTSIMIVGQVGGGLGDVTKRTTTASPAHGTQTDATWSTVAPAASAFQPPAQGPRVQSFGTEVAAGATTSLTWNNLRPGTYLLESGTHPSIQVPMGLYGVLVVTNAPTATSGTETTVGTAYPGIAYDADVPLVFGEIDPAQNSAVSTAVNTAGFSEAAVWSGQPGQCGNPASSNYMTCYPPVVNYAPLYYLINGVAFNRTNAALSLFPTAPANTLGNAGKILVRLVNAGSHMHIPSIVGSVVTVPTSPLSAKGSQTVGGMELIAEDGNPAPGVPHVQNEVFMAAGKTFDLMVNAKAANSTALAIYDRELSLSGNKINRDAGMLAYVGANGASVPAASGTGAATANADAYGSVIAGQAFSLADPGRGVLANDINVFGAKVSVAPAHGSLLLNANGTFTYTPDASWSAATPTVQDVFTYCGNGATSGPACAQVTLTPQQLETSTNITVPPTSWTSKLGNFIHIPSPGILTGAVDTAGYPLTVATSSISGSGFNSLIPDQKGGFEATVASPGTYTFTFKAQNSQGVLSNSVTVTVNFPTPNGPTVTVKDPKSGATISDYRWIIEEDRTFYVDPNCTTNPPPAGCPTAASGVVPALGVNFHTSDMPFVAQGCTGQQSCESGQSIIDLDPKSSTYGQHINAICDLGNGACRPDTLGSGKTPIDPSQITLDPAKRYYISVLPGDAANPFTTGNSSDPAGGCGTAAIGNNNNASTCGHGMGGAPIAPGQRAVTVIVQQSPFQPSKLAINVFEDDFPLNGEQDAGGGVDILATNEKGLGGFNFVLWDDMGATGDATGQMTYDMFNQPLSNSLDGTIDAVTGFNACPITQQGNSNPTGITGMITVCPQYESDGNTLSPLAGQAVVANLMPGRFGVQAYPGADRIARGEEWLQTNTLDGQKAQDSFLRIGEPAYFQEFGPANYHVSVGFANPKIINARLAGVCNGSDPNITGTNCVNTIKGKVTTERMSRTPDERLYSSGSHDSFSFTQCYVSVGDPDGEDFAFTKCNADGTFSISGLPSGNWRLTTFDQWNDLLLDGLSTPIALGASGPACPGTSTSSTVCDLGDLPIQQWQSNVYTRTFIDKSRSGVSNADDPGIPLIPVTVRFRDGSMSNNLSTDFDGTANFNETFPLFNWYVVESDTTRYKNTGTHTVYDAGGPADGTLTTCGGTANGTGYPSCGTSTIGKFMANTSEPFPLPANLSVPGSIYCHGADCANQSILNGPSPSGAGVSTGRIDTPWLGGVEGWQGFSGQNNFVEFGKEPYATGENGGIKGHVVYASTRPFDDPQMLVQAQWEPLVPHVTMNLYKEGVAGDGVTPTLTLVDTTQTSSWDDWAQGFHVAPDGTTVSNMNCPGQSTSDLFFFTLLNQPQYLDLYGSVLHGNKATTTIPYNSQYKCYDGMHNWNQLQPAVYDGVYAFPSVTSTDPSTGRPTATNCTICTPNHAVDNSDLYYGLPMLPTGKYVVEVVPPPGYEIVKEEDKNILIGDNFIAPSIQEFGGLGDIFILPDQAEVGSNYNANNAQNSTGGLGAIPRNADVPGFTEMLWPCVGETRVVPDYISLFPQTKQVSPFAGATRNLCDRKEVALNDQQGAIAKFYIFTSTHKASKFTGIITDDFTSEFDPFSPAFGEKFSPPNMPISVKDWTGDEVGRVYSDWWGVFDGLTYSTWEVNPPNPTGYSPNMMIMCMNDKGPIATNNEGQQTDPLYNSAYSQFCYELPFMPGETAYLDTPVVPTSAFSAGYNHPDCSYPDSTPSIAKVDGNGGGGGPWASASGVPMTITALGDQQVTNYGYSGPQATTAPFNAKTANRHYGFGAQCTTPTAASATCNTASSITIGGVSATIRNWSDTSITFVVPPTGGSKGVPACTIQQQAQYGGSTAYCGQLVITAGNGKQSVDTVTVTIGGKAPTYVTSTTPLSSTGSGSIQQAIDNAQPGDLIIVPPGTYNEMVFMWKPVRLQGVGAASSTIDANTQPAGKMDPWRRQLNCLFGLALNGQPATSNTSSTISSTNTNPYDATGTYSCGGWTGFLGNSNDPQVDRIPLEGILGWDTTLNGNLAQLLQEPTLMGAYEGAGITVLAKGVKVLANATSSYYGSGSEATFPAGTTALTSNDCGKGTPGKPGYLANPHPSNFWCNPARIDGLTITDASQGGGGIFAHGWTHNLEVSNNRIYDNIGTLSGGISIGQGEFPDAYLNGSVADNPGSCESGAGQPLNAQLPYCLQINVTVHNNLVTSNTSIGDELFTGTPAGAGGVSFCTGSDYYKFNYNWVCGNMSTGDGGGYAHIGWIKNGDVEHNSILFNQSLNPTIPTNGGGIVVMGAAPDGNYMLNGVATECGSVTDNDCVPGLSDGAGTGLVINANLIMGNAAEAGSGGGLRFQALNGADIPRWFNGRDSLGKLGYLDWNNALVTNNIIVNNVAGWDGGGVSFEDSLAVSMINNTIASNDSTATAGVLFNTIGAPLASTQSGATNQCQGGGAAAPGSTSNCTATSNTSAPQPGGVVSMQNSAQLTSSYPPGQKIACPPSSPGCGNFSSPYLANNIIWQNRSFAIGVGQLSPNYQQNIVTLYNSSFQGSPAPGPLQNQITSGQCVSNSSFWDIGVRGDTGPGNHGSGFSLAPTYSLLTNAIENGNGTNNVTGTNPKFVSQYCNGSRTPPEFYGTGGGTWNVPPGVADASVPNPIFNLAPAATVDEGNNWINMTWGPLSLVNPVTNAVLGNYSLTSGSPAIQKIPTNESAYSTNYSVLQFDFFGNSRPAVNNIDHMDIGAVETLTTAAPAFSLAGGTYHTPQTLYLTDSTPGAVIYYTYTANGSTPSCATSTPFTGPITVNTTGMVEAIACAPGYAPSPISSKAYVYTIPATAPSFSLAGGNYTTPQTLYLTDSTPGGVTIYYTYTTNGSTPSNTSTLYNPATGITINKTGVVEAVAYPNNSAVYYVSGVSSKSYTYVATLLAPTINPSNGTFAAGSGHSITLTDTTDASLPGFAIYYTTDGTTPNTTAGGSTHLYTGALTLNYATATTVTLKALATATGFPSSPVTTATYSFEPQLTAPYFQLAGGIVTAGSKLTFAGYTTPGNVTIYYTTDGSAPTTGSSVYNPATGIIINSTELVRAIAVAPGYLTSNSSSKLYIAF